MLLILMLSYIIFFAMNNHSTGSNILRKSYGYQGNDSPIPRSPTSKGFPMGFPAPHFPQQDHVPNSIKQLGNKIQGMESRIKKKYTQETQQTKVGNPKQQTIDGRSRGHFPMPNQQQVLSEQILRGSCQDILKKFDYTNLRNTTNFNVMNKVTTHNQVRRSPQEEHFQVRMNINKTMAQDHSNTFLKSYQKKILENKYSFVNPSRTPPKIIQEKQSGNGRSPHKYKTAVPQFIKTSDISKATTDVPQKKVFKSLNEIFENKSKEKQNIQAPKVPHSKIVNGFQIGTQLGKGKFGEVFLARHLKTGFIAAIKKIEKKKVVQFKMLDQFSKQITLHASLEHPNIVKFYGVFQEKDEIYLVMEYLNGGTLFDYLNQVNCLPVKTAVEYLRDIIEALSYMHDKSIAHRDIKPQNIVISSEGVAKLCDFGWSALVETTRKTYCGTFDYAPPEILQRKNYDTSVDIWCIGVLTYELLQGRVPFEGQQRNVVMQKIVNIDKTKIHYAVDIPNEAKQFIECLVQKDPALRPKCHDLLNFPLFTNYISKAGKPKKQI